MVRLPPAVLVAAALAVAVTALLVQAPAAGSSPPRGAAICAPGSTALLVDGSASMRDHDPGGALRRQAAGALDARLSGDAVSVRRFAQTLGAVRERGEAPGDITARVARVVAGGDRGETRLDGALRALARTRPRPAAVAVITDPEPAALGALPRALRGRPLVFAAAGGAPPTWMRQLARRSGGDAVALRDHAGAAAFASAVADASGCSAGAGSGPGEPPTGPNREPGEPPTGPGGAGPASRDGPAAPRATPPHTDVVLVAGLRDRAGEVRGAREPARCAAALSLATWCRALVASGRRVWVPSTAPRGRLGGGGRATLDSTGPLDANGAALARWAGRLLRERRPVFIGHSMGGLIAHAAIGWAGSRAGGLVTVGTPHAGSFGADAYLAARAGARACLLQCPGTAAALAAGAATVRVRFGGALDDLTRRRRTRIQPLPRLRLPLAAYAGAVNRAPGPIEQLFARRAADGARAPAGYVLPNDGIVGVGSALGAATAFTPGLAERDGRARHSASVLPPGAPTQLAAADVTAFLLTALDRLAPAPAPAPRPHRAPLPATAFPSGALGALGARAARRSPRGEFPRGAGKRPPARRGGRVVRRLTVALVPVTPLDDLAPGQAAGDPDGIVVSADPLTLACDGTGVDAVPVLGALWLLDLTPLGCTRVTSEPGPPGPAPRAVSLGAEAAEWRPAAGGSRATLLRRAGGAWRITVSGVDGRPEVRAGAVPVAMRPRRAAGGAAYRGAIGPRLARRAGELTVLARRGDGTALAASIELRP